MRLRPILAALVLVAGCGGSTEDVDPGPAGAADDGGAVTTSGAEAGIGPDGKPIVDPREPPGEGEGDGGVVSGGDAGPPSQCVGAAQDPGAATTVSSYIDKLTGVTKPTGAARDQIVDAIIKSCHVFSPPTAKNPGWERKHCWAHLVSAIAKESSYNKDSVVSDSYAKRMIGGVQANDPTVGLLQIRFSSAVRNYAVIGDLENLSCVGCTIPATLISHKAEAGSTPYWAVTGPSQNLAFTKSVACNVGIGAWYYYVNATSNGKPNAVTFVGSYCAGQGTAANLVTGLRSYVRGPDVGFGVIPDINGVNALQGTDATVYNYITAIKASFDSMIPVAGGKHPFFLTLSPNPTQYCR